MAELGDAGVLELTAQIVSAHVIQQCDWGRFASRP